MMQKDVTISRRIVTVLLKIILLKIKKDGQMS